MFKRLVIEISLINQKPGLKIVTNEFKKDFIKLIELHFGKYWNNCSYKEE